MTFYYKEFSLTTQFNMVSSVFTDAANSIAANAAATIGQLSGYEVLDLTLSGKFLKNYTFRAGVNNVLDEKYATRRSGGYPGPGILPGNGRTLFVTVGASF
jgi:Fe(3+) dicitrate transport protein